MNGLQGCGDLHEIWLVNGSWWIMLNAKVSWAFSEFACSRFFICLHFLLLLSLSSSWSFLAFMCMLLFLSFSIVSSLFLCAFVCCVGRTTSRQVEGCLLLQNSMAFWEWDKAPPLPIKPPKKSFSACCLVCGGLPLYNLKHSLHALNKLLPDFRSPQSPSPQTHSDLWTLLHTILPLDVPTRRSLSSERLPTQSLSNHKPHNKDQNPLLYNQPPEAQLILFFCKESI